MKLKLTITLVILAMGVTLANAQEVEKGNKFFNAGIGLGSTLYSGGYYKGTVPPVSASLEFIVKDDLLDGKGAIGVAGYVGYSAYKYEYLGWGWKYSNIIIGPRGSLHYAFVDKLDTYTGILLGYNVVTSKEFGNSVPGWDYSASSGGVIWSWYAGGRYFFTDNFAAMAELGYGIAYLNLGIALKF